jgi:hypothetical protein
MLIIRIFFQSPQALMQIGYDLDLFCKDQDVEPFLCSICQVCMWGALVNQSLMTLKCSWFLTIPSPLLVGTAFVAIVFINGWRQEWSVPLTDLTFQGTYLSMFTDRFIFQSYLFHRTRLNPSLALRNLILKLQVQCITCEDHEGHGWAGSFEQWQAHMLSAHEQFV